MFTDPDALHDDPVADIADAPVALHRAWTAVFLPTVTIHVTSRRATAATAVYLYDFERGGWSMPSGLTVAITAAWTFDRVFAPRHPSIPDVISYTESP